jgi:hypothetical protein
LEGADDGELGEAGLDRESIASDRRSEMRSPARQDKAAMMLFRRLGGFLLAVATIVVVTELSLAWPVIVSGRIFEPMLWSLVALKATLVWLLLLIITVVSLRTSLVASETAVAASIRLILTLIGYWIGIVMLTPVPDLQQFSTHTTEACGLRYDFWTPVGLYAYCFECEDACLGMWFDPDQLGHTNPGYSEESGLIELWVGQPGSFRKASEVQPVQIRAWAPRFLEFDVLGMGLILINGVVWSWWLANVTQGLVRWLTPVSWFRRMKSAHRNRYGSG